MQAKMDSDMEMKVNPVNSALTTDKTMEKETATLPGGNNSGDTPL